MPAKLSLLVPPGPLALHKWMKPRCQFAVLLWMTAHLTCTKCSRLRVWYAQVLLELCQCIVAPLSASDNLLFETPDEVLRLQILLHQILLNSRRRGGFPLSESEASIKQRKYDQTYRPQPPKSSSSPSCLARRKVVPQAFFAGLVGRSSLSLLSVVGNALEARLARVRDTGNLLGDVDSLAFRFGGMVGSR